LSAANPSFGVAPRRRYDPVAAGDGGGIPGLSDSEYFPERAECEGFLTAGRFVCIDGWPGCLALYDLADTDVLRGPAYARIVGERYSPWTHRIVSRV
jgi:hypothetical protein